MTAKLAYFYYILLKCIRFQWQCHKCWLHKSKLQHFVSLSMNMQRFYNDFLATKLTCKCIWIYVCVCGMCALMIQFLQFSPSRFTRSLQFMQAAKFLFHTTLQNYNYKIVHCNCLSNDTYPNDIIVCLGLFMSPFCCCIWSFVCERCGFCNGWIYDAIIGAAAITWSVRCLYV